MGGDSKMTKEEYAEGHYRRDQLHPEVGCRYFLARLKGAGYRRRVDCVWTLAAAA